MEALAIYARPVPVTAVDYLLQPYLPGVNSAPVLSRLVNMQFARKESGRYYLHPVDRAYAQALIPEGEASDRYLDDAPPFSQFALRHRGADYFGQIRTPREQWQTIDDLAPQLAEFDLRYAGQEYDAAGEVLIEIDSTYLLVWGFYRQVAELHERLQGRLGEPRLKQASMRNLGSSKTSIGQYQQAITCYEQALVTARELGDQFEAKAALSDLGWCYGELGRTAQAIDYSEQALSIAHELGDRSGQAAVLANLGWYYGKLGQTGRAIDCCKQALTIMRKTGHRLGEGGALSNLAGVMLDKDSYKEVVKYARQSVQIGEELNAPILGNWSNGFLALAHLFAGDLAAARAAAEAARQYDEPENNIRAQ